MPLVGPAPDPAHLIRLEPILNTQQNTPGLSDPFGQSTTARSRPPRPVGCDDGHYGIKVCAGENVFFTLPSRAHPGRLATSSIAGGKTEDLIYETADGEFVTITANDMLSPAVDTRLPDYPTSSPNRALVAHALRSAGIKGDVSIVTGLPVNRFYLEGNRNDELIEGKRASLLRPVRCLSGAETPRVVSHKVISEAVASYYDALLDFEGGYNMEFKEISDEEPVAVVDAGGKTLDVATIKEGGTGIYPGWSGTADAGVLYLYDNLDAALRLRFEITDPIPFERLDRAIATGKFRVYSERHDVRNIVGEQLDQFADRVSFEARKFLGDASRFGKVLFVGGGANLLADRLDRVFPGLPPNAITVAPVGSDPSRNSAFANARGMYKAALADAQNG